ncbi:MAG: chromate efflux transporter [Bdellovibrionota bacterium]
MSRSPSALKEIFVYFFRLGLTGFGGPLALISAMQKDLVETRRWMTLDEFSRAFALIKAMPGPIAFQMAVFLGRHRAGFAGATVAAVMLNLPAFIAMIFLGAFEETFVASPAIRTLLSGMQAAALGLILASTKGLFWNFRARGRFWSIFAIGLAVVYTWPSFEPLFIVAAGLISVVLAKKFVAPKIAFIPLVGLSRFPWFTHEGASTAVIVAGSWWGAFGPLVWNCFKAGAFVFGSGIAIVPLMENDFVTNLRWLTHEEFMNALAFGQITPGPVVITATYIGFKSLGLVGAFAATIAIFLAPFFHMTTWFPHAMSRLSRQTWIDDFILGAIAVVTAAVLTSVVSLATGSSFSWIHYVVLALSFIAVLLAKAPAWVVIPGGGLVVLLAGIAKIF